MCRKHTKHISPRSVIGLQKYLWMGKLYALFFWKSAWIVLIYKHKWTWLLSRRRHLNSTNWWILPWKYRTLRWRNGSFGLLLMLLFRLGLYNSHGCSGSCTLVLAIDACFNAISCPHRASIDSLTNTPSTVFLCVFVKPWGHFIDWHSRNAFILLSGGNRLHLPFISTHRKPVASDPIYLGELWPFSHRSPLRSSTLGWRGLGTQLCGQIASIALSRVSPQWGDPWPLWKSNIRINKTVNVWPWCIVAIHLRWLYFACLTVTLN